MKKKKKVIWIVSIVAFLLCIGLTILIVSLTKQGQQENIRTILAESLSDTLRAAEETVDGESTPAFIIRLESMSSYEILNITMAEDNITTTLKVSSPDLYGIVKKLEESRQTVSREEAFELVDSLLSNSTITEKKVPLSFEMIDGRYVPILTSEFLDAYYGGVFRLQQELILNQKQENEKQ